MLLLYCMTQDDPPSACVDLRGVGGTMMRDVARNGVRYFYSEWAPPADAKEVKAQAFEFHRAVHALFEHTTVIPFRFPTGLASEADLAQLMEEQSSDYAQELTRLQGAVQMKATVEGGSHLQVTVTTGTEYLKQRQVADAPMNTSVEQFMRVAKPIVMDVKQTRRGKGTTVLFLLQRDRLQHLRAAIEALGPLPAAVSVSGPWPPVDFVNCYPEPPQDRP